MLLIFIADQADMTVGDLLKSIGLPLLSELFENQQVFMKKFVLNYILIFFLIDYFGCSRGYGTRRTKGSGRACLWTPTQDHKRSQGTMPGTR